MIGKLSCCILKCQVSATDWIDVKPTAVNAYYSPHTNTLFVPAGLLQPPFVDPAYGTLASLEQPSADDWGSLGVLLGHEMSHAFDTTGRLFDASLQFKPWWSPSSTKQYERRAACIASAYSSQKDSGIRVNGNRTIGEDIADISGLKLAYTAWRGQTGVSAVDDGTQTARFFESFGRMWCHQTSVQMMGVDAVNNPHAPPRVRVNMALSLTKEFRRRYGCKAPASAADCALW